MFFRGPVLHAHPGRFRHGHGAACAALDLLLPHPLPHPDLLLAQETEPPLLSGGCPGRAGFQIPAGRNRRRAGFRAGRGLLPAAADSPEIHDGRGGCLQAPDQGIPGIPGAVGA